MPPAIAKKVTTWKLFMLFQL